MARNGSEVARGVSGDGYQVLVAPAGIYDLAVSEPGAQARLQQVEVKANLTYVRTF
jgi:hypothetical protein